MFLWPAISFPSVCGGVVWNRGSHATMIQFLGFFFTKFIVSLFSTSENTPEGRRVTKLDEILLNGNNIAMVSTGI